MSSMWDDFLDFDLRCEDFVYQRPERTWGYLYNRYLFISFLDEKLVRKCNLILQLFQQSRENKALEKSRRFRGNRIINAEWIPRKYINELSFAIKEKERLKRYLEQHYEKITKEHGKVEMITLSFHLPKMARPSRNYFDMKFQLALKLLKEKFDKLKKQIQSDRFFTQFCGYSRLILLTEKCEPFYLVNFFVKCKKNLIIDSHNIACNISDLWRADEKLNENDPWRLYILRLGEYKKLLDNDDIGLVVARPNELSRMVHNQRHSNNDILEWILEPDVSLSNNKRGCFDFFLIQARQYNIIPGIRACSTSTNLTYMNAAVIKARQARKKIHKKE